MHWTTVTGDFGGLPESLARLARLRRTARDLGCEIKAGSRLDVFETHLRRFERAHYNPMADPDFNPALLSHGGRDLRELDFVCEKLVPLHAEKMRDTLPTLLRGPSIPGDNPDSERPRNLQFEYFLAAQLVHSGLTVTLDEPDVIFVHEAKTVPVAAKRPISVGQFIPRLREAVRQLKKVDGEGLVALSLDRLLPVSPPYVCARTEQALDEAAHTLLLDALKPHAMAAREVTRASPILGLFVSMCAVGCIGVPWQPAFTSATLILPRDDDLPQELATVQKIIAALRAPSEPSAG